MKHAWQARQWLSSSSEKRLWFLTSPHHHDSYRNQVSSSKRIVVIKSQASWLLVMPVLVFSFLVSLILKPKSCFTYIWESLLNLLSHLKNEPCMKLESCVEDAVTQMSRMRMSILLLFQYLFHDDFAFSLLISTHDSDDHDDHRHSCLPDHHHDIIKDCTSCMCVKSKKMRWWSRMMMIMVMNKTWQRWHTVWVGFDT